jgi:hypothetical protein
VSDESDAPPESPPESSAPELEREQRRLERLRLVNELWPPPDRFEYPDPAPPDAA